jgi:hypothetical protein
MLSPACLRLSGCLLMQYPSFALHMQSFVGATGRSQCCGTVWLRALSMQMVQLPSTEQTAGA